MLKKEKKEKVGLSIKEKVFWSFVNILLLTAVIASVALYLKADHLQKERAQTAVSQVKEVKNQYSIETLKGRLEDVKKLDRALEEKISNIEAAKSKLQEKIAVHEAIVIERSNQLNINDIEKAEADEQISSSLKIIQTTEVYIEKIAEAELTTKKKRLELQVLKEKFDSDVLVAEAIADDQVEDLVKAISEVIEKYGHYADEYVVQGTAAPGSLDKIWENLRKRKNQELIDQYKKTEKEKEASRKKADREREELRKKAEQERVENRKKIEMVRLFIEQLQKDSADLFLYRKIEHNAFFCAGGEINFSHIDVKNHYSGTGFSFDSKAEKSFLPMMTIKPEKMIFHGQQIVLGMTVVSNEQSLCHDFQPSNFRLYDIHGAYFVPSHIHVINKNYNEECRSNLKNLLKGRETKIFLIFNDAEINQKVFEGKIRWEMIIKSYLMRSNDWGSFEISAAAPGQ